MAVPKEEADATENGARKTGGGRPGTVARASGGFGRLGSAVRDVLVRATGRRRSSAGAGRADHEPGDAGPETPVRSDPPVAGPQPPPGLREACEGMKAEWRGDAEGAMALYGAAIEAGFKGSQPYERLLALRLCRDEHAEALRVAETYLRMAGSMPPRERGEQSGRIGLFEAWAERCRRRSRGAG